MLQIPWVILLIPFHSNTSILTADSSPPIIMNCPDDIQEDIEIGTLTIIVTWTEPTAVDNSGQDSMVTRNSFPGMPFAAGTREVVYIFSDSDNNEATCSFNVTVIPGEVKICWLLWKEMLHIHGIFHSQKYSIRTPVAIMSSNNDTITLNVLAIMYFKQFEVISLTFAKCFRPNSIF